MPINATTATADTQLNRQKSESPKKPQTIAFNNVFFSRLLNGQETRKMASGRRTSRPPILCMNNGQLRHTYHTYCQPSSDCATLLTGNYFSDVGWTGVMQAETDSKPAS